ncbi:hypothetical protein C6495_16620 [Candidatus Poribacteria bacterium]|nr:MAG: hypothetical protein C6495_16620 [Candidatus Poribacteria bacterium]
MFNFKRIFPQKDPQPTVDALNYIPFHLVGDWKPGDRITVAGESAEIYEVVPRKSPAGNTVASIRVMYDNEPGVVRLVEFDFQRLQLER